ncbi:GrpB family protein [Saccharibacillus sp. JS10]|uniref:GrpB family protein n=1 Tax=Saccharibacillus sp. JS10 TaxID=2950552 RepID=UPI00210DCEDA|nr:GrpB family protein [Saccharibacillus sp. JS10]MCQ4085356.1 GrpB family protein [Saccharibacillus sp. JS10]
MTNNHNPEWPVWATESVEIKPFDSEWLAKGNVEGKHLHQLLKPYGVNVVEHIGSTSVQGLPAKPILDLMAEIPSFDELDKVVAALLEQDWHYVPPELDGIPSRRFFVKVKQDKRQCHLHLMLPGEERWERQLRFRDILRNRPHFVTEYAHLKMQLAERHKDDREAYTRAKTDFVARVLNEPTK